MYSCLHPQYTVDVAGGHGAGWLACWAAWIGLHLVDSLFPLWHAPGARRAEAAADSDGGGGGVLAGVADVSYRVVKAFGLPTLAGLVAYRSQVEGLQLLGRNSAMPAWL